MKPALLIASPLPPARSEIANNVADTQLPALARSREVVLVAGGKDAPDPGRLHGARVATIAEAARGWPHAPLVAHLGNHPDFIAPVAAALALRPGIAVLHDVVLHHAFYERCVADQRPVDYLSALRRHYGREAERQGRVGLEEPEALRRIAARYPLFEPFLESALGVVVHSRMAFETVADRECWPVCQLQLPYPAPDEASARAILQRRAAQAEELAKGGALRLVVFGHLEANRGLPAILEAMASLSSLSSLSPVSTASTGLWARLELEVCGTVGDRADLERRIAQFGLEPNVRLRGYVSDAELDAALAHAHLALNLRSPTVGEASASQLRIYAAGLASVVTRQGWYAEQPESAVRFVRPGREAAGLAGIFAELLRAPRQLPALAAAGMDHLRGVHDPQAHADGLIEFIARAASPGTRLLVARRYAGRAALGLNDLGGPGAGLTPSRRLAQAIEELLPRQPHG